MRLTKTLSLCVLGLSAVLLAGCGDAEDITIHEPGVYKGEPDPLINKSKTAAHSEKLNERILMVQTDR